MREKGRTQTDAVTLLMSSDDMDKALLAFMLANGARSMGLDVNIFFALWGLNLLRRLGNQPNMKSTPTEMKPPGIMQRMMGMIMPKGPRKSSLSKMNFGGMGPVMMRRIMKQKGISSLPELMNMSVELGVSFTICSLTMEIMGFTEKDILDLPNLSFGGVTSCLGNALNSRLFLIL